MDTRSLGRGANCPSYNALRDAAVRSCSSYRTPQGFYRHSYSRASRTGLGPGVFRQGTVTLQRVDNRSLLEAITATAATATRVSPRWRYGSDLNAAAAGAGLHRAAQLVADAVLLCGSTTTVGAGVLVRAAYEFTVVGSFVLHGGRDALLAVDLDRLEAEYRLGRIRQINPDRMRMLEEQIANTRRHFEGRKRPSTTLRDMAERVGVLAEEMEGSRVNAYDSLYRAHSMMDVHPPKVLKQMVDLSGPQMKVRALGPWGDQVGGVGVVSLYLAILGKWIAVRVGSSPAVWQTHLATLIEMLDTRHVERMIESMEEDLRDQ
jgi:hypothetical protein